MRKISSLWFASAAAMAFPALAFAQQVTTLEGALARVEGIFNILIVLMVALGVVVLFWGLVQYLTKVGEAKHEGLVIMFYGIITLVVMISVWGIVSIVSTTFGLSGGAAPKPPQVPSLQGIIR